MKYLLKTKKRMPNRLITKGAGSEKEIWIISDGRRRGDIGYLKREYGGRVVAVRVEASEMVRKERGWLFTPGEWDNCWGHE